MSRTLFSIALLLTACQTACHDKPIQYHGVVCPEGAWIEVEKKQYAEADAAVYCMSSLGRQGPYAVWERELYDLDAPYLQRLDKDGELFRKSVEGYYRNGYRCGRHVVYVNGRVDKIEFYDSFGNLTGKEFFYDEKGELRQVGKIEKGDVDEVEWQRLAATAPTIGVISAEELAYCAD